MARQPECCCWLSQNVLYSPKAGVFTRAHLAAGLKLKELDWVQTASVPLRLPCPRHTLKSIRPHSIQDRDEVCLATCSYTQNEIVGGLWTIPTTLTCTIALSTQMPCLSPPSKCGCPSQDSTLQHSVQQPNATASKPL